MRNMGVYLGFRWRWRFGFGFGFVLGLGLGLGYVHMRVPAAYVFSFVGYFGKWLWLPVTLLQL